MFPCPIPALMPLGCLFFPELRVDLFILCVSPLQYQVSRIQMSKRAQTVPTLGELSTYLKLREQKAGVHPSLWSDFRTPLPSSPLYPLSLWGVKSEF